MKLRLLNGGALRARLPRPACAATRRSRDAVADAELRGFLERLLETELAPTLGAGPRHRPRPLPRRRSFDALGQPAHRPPARADRHRRRAEAAAAAARPRARAAGRRAGAGRGSAAWSRRGCAGSTTAAQRSGRGGGRGRGRRRRQPGRGGRARAGRQRRVRRRPARVDGVPRTGGEGSPR